jgi:hypothetical protein
MVPLYLHEQAQVFQLGLAVRVAEDLARPDREGRLGGGDYGWD